MSDFMMAFGVGVQVFIDAASKVISGK